MILRPFLPYIAGGALLAVVAGAGMIWWQSGTIDTLRAESASQARSLAAWQERAAQAELARKVDAARAERERQRSAELRATIEQMKEIPDAPLDPRLIDLLDGLRPGD